MTPEERAGPIVTNFQHTESLAFLEMDIAEAIRAAITEQREKDARIADKRAEHWKLVSEVGICTLPLQEEAEDIAAAIRKGE